VTYPSLKGRVVFVTGGASGIGADIVRAFAANGSKVAFVDVLETEGCALAKELGATFIRCDVTDTDALKAAIGKVGRELGPIRVLVNNAANDDRHKIDEVTVDYWDKAQDINLKHQFFAAQAVRSQMKEAGGGSIINFSSIAWRFGANGMVAYGVAKAAIHGLTRALGREFGPEKIRVNSIEPGAVMTERQRRLWYPEQKQVDEFVARQPLRRVLLGSDIARTVLFLAADDSDMISRQTIVVDAGLS
jgi:NAD(P)-dependent dehydrogenase (short-subunit alcohol dehydrogenase family)